MCFVCRAGAAPAATVRFAYSMLALQAHMIMGTVPLGAVEPQIHVVGTLDEALNVLRRAPRAPGAAVLDVSMGFDPLLVLEAAALALAGRGRGLVAAAYPVPAVDWARVEATAADGDENPAWSGHVYSADVLDLPDAPGELASADGRAEPFQRLAPGAGLGVFWVDRAVLADVEARHPGIVAEDGSWAAFATGGVHGGRRATDEGRFWDLLGPDVPVWTQLGRQATSMGPMEFGGCVGLRHVLRN